MRQGMLKITQMASKVSPEGAKWAHLGPLFSYFWPLGAFLCAFLLIFIRFS